MHQHNKNMYCLTENWTIAQLYVLRNIIDESPEYQRESAVWSPLKQKTFIDSLINNFDIPKIYFHDLRDKKGNKESAIIDGKQRVTTIYDFLDNKFPLADNFKLHSDSRLKSVLPEKKFIEFTQTDKDVFKSISIPVVLVRNANEDDIEELFSRLNNGEPLNAAEKRNGINGDMTDLIRELCTNDFFTKKLKFANKRYSYLEIAAKFFLLEKIDMDSNGELFSDLKKKHLDSLVQNNKKMPQGLKESLDKRVVKNLSIMRKIFNDKDPLLSKQSFPPLYYIFIKMIHSLYGHANLNTYIRKFIEDFHVQRQQNLLLEEDIIDSQLIEFGRLMQQGTNDIGSLKNRITILTKYFLVAYPDVKILDTKRHFSEDERYAIFVLSKRKCEECSKDFSDIKEMEADHIEQYAFGGETTLKNARALCIECNQKLKKTKK